MRIRTWSAALIALAIVGSSCSENDIAGPRALRLKALAAASAGTARQPAVRISEFHYDNAGADSAEKVEISGPAGTSLVGWQLVLYNGAAASRAPYTTTTLDGALPATCGGRGVVVINYPTSIQNGDPDGIALVKPNGNVVEFLSYGGTFVAASGPAVGMLTTDIGVKEVAEPPTVNHVTSSLQRGVDGVWFNSNKNANVNARDNTFGSCNDNGPVPPSVGDVATVTVTPLTATISTSGSQLFSASAVDADNQPAIDSQIAWSTSNANATVNGNGFVTGKQPGDVQVIATAPNGVSGEATLHVNLPAPLPATRFSEIHYNPVGTDAGEAIEIEGPAETDLDGWQIVLYNGNGGGTYGTTVTLSGRIPATCGARGVIVTNYESNGLQNGPDGFALVNAASTVVEFLSYQGSFTATDGPANGMTSIDIGVSENAAPTSQSLQRLTSGVWKGPFTSTFGACNGDGGAAVGKAITFTGRLASDPALPVGFEDQLFPTLHNGANTVPTTFAWESATPDIASIDANGVIHALAEGTATFIATAADGPNGTTVGGTTATYSLPTIVATLGGTADYAGNTEFGVPTDADQNDDFIITRDQYTISYNKNRNTPNWVSYEFDATHFAQNGTTVDRCDCFTHDPALPASFTHLTTADYTGAGAFAGFGIDRGHLARSFDFTSGALDNARSYYFSNIIPQFADLNQGPWAILENYLGDRARNANKEVYVIDGVAGSKGTLKDEGKIVIPATVWKVALVLPLNHRLADVHDYRDIEEVIAVIAPNEPGVRNVDWTTYKTTVDEVERVSGYDLLSLLPDKIERAVESNSRPPIAVTNGPYTSTEGSALSLSASESFDGSGTIVGYSWTFGDGASASGATSSHTYAQDGTYMVRLIVSDNLGVADTSFTSASVANVVPTVAPFAGATLLPGETYSASGSFTDPGADPWNAIVNYGDNPGLESLLLSGKTFGLSHTYMGAGRFTVTVRVSDDDATGTRTQFVTVLAPSEGLTQAARLLEDLANAADLNSGNTNSLSSKIDAALKQLANGNSVPAANQLRALLREVDAMILSGRVNARDAEPLQAMVGRVIRSISL
jgi:DNA/RNA endonuclease G (NUC1)